MRKEYYGLTRRRFIHASGAIAAGLHLQQAGKSLKLMADDQVCKLIAEQEQGPFYIEDALLRSDIVAGKPGLPLTLRIQVLDSRTCTPLTDAAVDLWHCDAMGVYAGFSTQTMGGPPSIGAPTDMERPVPMSPMNGSRPAPPVDMGPPPDNYISDKLTFLRGIQITGPEGDVNFQTIFPGFYMGRTNHIHFKVRVGGRASGKSYKKGHVSHTGQLFFPEEIAAELMKHEPYSQHKLHRTTEGEDAVFHDQHGEMSIAKLEVVDANKVAAGMHAELVVAVDPTATPGPVRRSGGRPR
jgi:protocatechuate 3,4-dioxygenase beta subunit